VVAPVYGNEKSQPIPVDELVLAVRRRAFLTPRTRDHKWRYRSNPFQNSHQTHTDKGPNALAGNNFAGKGDDFMKDTKDTSQIK
jgi:hypothetical protein